MKIKPSDQMFEVAEIAEAYRIFQRIGEKSPLGVLRWDRVVQKYPVSGVIKIPVKLAYHSYTEPIYIVFDKVYNQETLHIRPLKGEPYRMGDIFGFSDILGFEDFQYGKPIILVEGRSDKVALMDYYPHVLALQTSTLSDKQLFFLMNITDKLVIAMDPDDAGRKGFSQAYKKLKKQNLQTYRLLCPRDDWGKLGESDYGNMIIERSIERVPWIQKL